MIVEFCKYGNLSNYLRSKRDDFLVYKVSHKLHDLDFPALLLSHLAISSIVWARNECFDNNTERLVSSSI